MIIGPDALDNYNGLNLTEEGKKDVAKIIQKFESYAIGEKNEVYE